VYAHKTIGQGEDDREYHGELKEVVKHGKDEITGRVTGVSSREGNQSLSRNG